MDKNTKRSVIMTFKPLLIVVDNFERIINNRYYYIDNPY